MRSGRLGSQLAFFSLVLVLASCTPDTARPVPNGTEANPTTLTVLVGNANERILRNAPAAHLVFLPLFDFDQTGEPRGLLVRDWELMPDGRTWIHHLRTDVRWHDGTPVTAHDILFTHELRSHPDVLAWNPAVQTVEVLDDSTFTVEYHTPGSPGPLDWWTFYLPRHLLQDLDPAEFYEWEFWTRPVGNGPYRYLRHVPETYVELEANADYFEGRPAIERVILRFGGSNARLELQAGRADAAVNLSPIDAFGLSEQDARFRSYTAPSSGTYMLQWNHRHEAFRDREVREALSRAIDRGEIAAALDYPPGLPIVDVPMSYEEMLRGSAPDPRPFDLDLAQGLLERAGWVDADNDGVRERNGVPLRFRCLTSESAAKVAIVLREQLRRIGVALEIETLAAQFVRGRMSDGDFETAVLVRRFDYMSRYGWVYPPSARSFGFYEEPALAELMGKLAGTMVPEERDGLFEAIWAIWREEYPAMVLVNSAHATVAHRRLRGLSSPYRVFLFTHMSELWIGEDPVIEAGGH